MVNQKTIHNHLGKMAALPKLLNTDLSQGFTGSRRLAGVLGSGVLGSGTNGRSMPVIKKQTAMVKKVFPDCQGKNTLSFLELFFLFEIYCPLGHIWPEPH